MLTTRGWAERQKLQAVYVEGLFVDVFQVPQTLGTGKFIIMIHSPVGRRGDGHSRHIPATTLYMRNHNPLHEKSQTRHTKDERTRGDRGGVRLPCPSLSQSGKRFDSDISVSLFECGATTVMSFLSPRVLVGYVSTLF